MQREWTSEMVIAGLVAEFRAMPGRAIYSPPLGSPLRALTGEDAQWNYLCLTWWCMGRDRTALVRRQRLALLTYCACMATSSPLAERCRDLPFTAQVATRMAKAAAQRVAEVMSVAMEVALMVEQTRLTASKSAGQSALHLPHGG